jgi:hypothetical protein
MPIEPNIVVETSPGKAHYYFLCEGIAKSEFTGIETRLIDDYGSDPNAKDLARVLRLPGFYHNKKKPHLVKISHESGSLPYSRDAIIKAFPPVLNGHKKESSNPENKNKQDDVVTDKLIDDLRSALKFLSANGYDPWIRSGLALSSLGDKGYVLWLEYGMTSDKFSLTEALEKWSTFKPNDITYKSIFHDAYANGWDGNKKANTAIIQLPKWENPTFKIILNSENEIHPYHGVMDAVVKQILHIANKPQPELTILSTLIGMASAIGGNYKLPGGGRLNLYGIGISGTGTGKDKPMRAGVYLAGIGGSEIIGMPGSGAALEDSLEENNTKLLLNIDEVAHFIAAMNDSKQTHMASVSSNLLKLFSASSSIYVTRKLANSSGNTQKTCINPCVSLLGFACPDKLGEAFGSSANIADGLIGRLLFAIGRENVSPRRSNTDLHFHSDITNIGKAINHSDEIVISYSKEADSRLEELMNIFDSSSISSTNPFAKDLKMRSFEKCERIAGILAVWETPNKPVITIEHVEWAEMFINYSDDAILKFSGNNMHGGEVQSNAEKIRRVINKMRSGEIIPTKDVFRDILKFPGNFPRSSILKASKLAKKDFDLAIDHLIDLDEVKIGIKELNGESYKVIFYL